MNVRREWTASSGYRCNFLGIFRGFVAGKERDPVSPWYAGVSPGSAAGKTARALSSALYRSLCSRSYEFRWTSRGNRRLKTVINPSPRHDKNETRRCSADVELLPPFSSKLIVARDVAVRRFRIAGEKGIHLRIRTVSARGALNV
jgi:hypothetical protein